ncbi:serine/threonine-protein kinase [Frankia gtarii]|uniref:serine/threonine-protein kinase n=1 Tax=Frankia gtarii TaxID=2950102 RepID=UPI0021C07272|nr:serine/threonine-protein kinase [Frankia gtarii]
MRDGIDGSLKLLRLEVRAANPSSASSTWEEVLASLPGGTREWLLRNRSGQAKRITEKLGARTLELLYRWCAAGVVVFDVEPPPGHDTTHGPLLGWRLTEPARSHAEGVKRRLDARRCELADEAKLLTEKLSNHPQMRLLGQALAERRDLTYLEHAVTVAQAVVTEEFTHPGHERTGSEAAETCFVLQRLARGLITDYVVDREMIERGGQAIVSGATHKVTRARVAFKRLRIRDDDAVARMRREIDASRLFGEHPNVMPVLDADPESRWLVMPLATGTARTYIDELRKPGQLYRLVSSICEALRQPHNMGWIHRDLKPENVLLFDDRWTVADWGLGRRPHGETSDPGRTRTGTGFGTEGFAAPELSLDAHEVGPPSDVYSIGQLIGSIVTGRHPEANIPLVPDSGPWRDIVERTTRYDPSERPSSVDHLLILIKSLH